MGIAVGISHPTPGSSRAAFSPKVEHKPADPSQVPNPPQATAAKVKEVTKVTLGDRIKNYFSKAINPFLYPVFRGFDHKASKAEENARLIEAIGGEPHQLRSKDGAKINMTLVTTEAFTQKIKEAGGVLATLTCQNDPELAVKAICFSDAEATQFLHTLAGTAFFDIGWNIIKEGDRSYVVSNRDFALLIKQKLVDKAKGKELPKMRESLNVALSDQPLFHSTKSTVILCPGIKGRKESVGNIQDMAAYLMQGLNVVIFDYRGTGKSKGCISEKGLMMDLEAICDHLVQLGIEDLYQLLVGNCFGAGPATAFAAKREVNLLLNQPYANIKRFAKDQIKYKKDPSIPAILPKKLQLAYFEAFGPDYDLPELLKNVKGHIGIIINETDDQVNGQHDYSNLAALPNNLKGQIIKPMFVAGIEHGAGWYTPPKDNVNGKMLQLKHPTMTPEDFVLIGEDKHEKFVTLGEQQVANFLYQTGLSDQSLLNSY